MLRGNRHHPLNTLGWIKGVMIQTATHWELTSGTLAVSNHWHCRQQRRTPPTYYVCRRQEDGKSRIHQVIGVDAGGVIYKFN